MTEDKYKKQIDNAFENAHQTLKTVNRRQGIDMFLSLLSQLQDFDHENYDSIMLAFYEESIPEDLEYLEEMKLKYPSYIKDITNIIESLEAKFSGKHGPVELTIE